MIGGHSCAPSAHPNLLENCARLGWTCFARQLDIEQRQCLGAPIAAAHRDDSSDGWIAPRVVNGCGSKCGLTRDKPLAGTYALVVDDLVTERAQFNNARVEFVTLERAGGRYQRYTVARLQPARLDPLAFRCGGHRNEAISAAIA